MINKSFSIPLFEGEVFIPERFSKRIWQYSNDEPGMDLSNQNGYHSMLNPPGFRSEVLRMIDDINLPFRYLLENFWFNINTPGAFNWDHDHPGSDLSGVIWIQVPPNSGNLVFRNPYAFQMDNLCYKFPPSLKKELLLASDLQSKPSEGRGIVFPSFLMHHVEVNESSDNRISVSFNLKV